MNAISGPVVTPESAASLYASSRGGSIFPLSISNGISELRRLSFETPLSDRQLGDLLAAAAVKRGLSVNFDQSYNERGFLWVEPLPKTW